MPHRRPHPKLPLQTRRLLPVAMVIAIAMLSYFAHLVSEAVQRGADARLHASTPADSSPTIPFASHAAPARR